MDSQQVYQVAHQVFNDEIAGVLQVQGNLNDDFVKAVQLILECKGKLIVTGMGKSGHIGNKIAATMASTGTPAFFVHPAEALHGDLGMIESSDVVLAISYSGESDELIAILPTLKRKDIPLIGVTGNRTSSLAKISECVLDIGVDKEACPLGLAPTTSTTATLVLGDALAVCLLSLRNFKKEDFALSHPGGTLGRRLLITAADLMHTGDLLPSVTAEATLSDVVREISEKRLGLAGVVNSNNTLIGVVTDGDLRRLLGLKIDLLTTRAVDIMNRTPKTLKADDLAVEAVELMEKHQITGFLVVDNENHLLGIFNLHDLFKAKLL